MLLCLVLPGTLVPPRTPGCAPSATAPCRTLCISIVPKKHWHLPALVPASCHVTISLTSVRRLFHDVALARADIGGHRPLQNSRLGTLFDRQSSSTRISSNNQPVVNDHVLSPIAQPAVNHTVTTW
eukprot:EG_transcript_34284